MRMDKQRYERLNITLPADLLNKFSEYCEKEGMMLSSRIATLIEQDLERYRGEWIWERFSEIQKINFVNKKLAETGGDMAQSIRECRVNGSVVESCK